MFAGQNTQQLHQIWKRREHIKMQSFDPFDLFNQNLNFRQLEGFYELELADWGVNRKFRIVAMDNVSTL